MLCGDGANKLTLLDVEKREVVWEREMGGQVRATNARCRRVRAVALVGWGAAERRPGWCGWVGSGGGTRAVTVRVRVLGAAAQRAGLCVEVV